MGLLATGKRGHFKHILVNAVHLLCGLLAEYGTDLTINVNQAVCNYANFEMFAYNIQTYKKGLICMMYHKPFLPRHASSRYNPSAATNPPTHQDPRKSITIFKGHVNLCVDLGAGGPCRWAAWIVLGVIIQNLPPQSPLLLGLSYLTETNEVFKSQSKIPSTFTFFTLTLLVFSCLFLAPKLHAFPSSELASICQRNLTNAEAPIGWFEPMAPKVFIACLDKWHNANIPTWNQFFGFCLFPTSRSSVPCTPHIPLYNPSLKKMKAMNECKNAEVCFDQRQNRQIIDLRWS